LEDCDRKFREMLPKIEKLEQRKRQMTTPVLEPDMEIIGLILVELASSAFWSSLVLFYQISLLMVEVQIERGSFPQCGIGLIHLASIIIHRLGMVNLGIELADIGLSWLQIFQSESYAVGRGLTLHTLFISPLTSELTYPVNQLNEAWSASMAAGDRINSLLNLGINAFCRIWSSQDLQETEFLTQDSGSEFVDWVIDMRGGKCRGWNLETTILTEL
jgi:hypothetical protein